jgi:hypothetical protein
MVSIPSSVNVWTGVTAGGLYFEIMKSYCKINSHILQQINFLARHVVPSTAAALSFAGIVRTPSGVTFHISATFAVRSH